MLSIKKCEDVLNKEELNYNEKQIKEIREFLYAFALIADELNSKK